MLYPPELHAHVGTISQFIKDLLQLSGSLMQGDGCSISPELASFLHLCLCSSNRRMLSCTPMAVAFR
jgi:hypothetical protein